MADNKTVDTYIIWW